MNRRKSRTDKREHSNLGIDVVKRVNFSLDNNRSTSNNNTVGERIRQARFGNDLTLRQLAAAAGVTPEALSHIENEKSLPSLPTLRTLAQILNASIAYLGCFDSLPEDTLGQRITKMRLSLGKEQAEFAREIGVNAKTLYGWEKDKHLPKSDYLSKINSFFGII